MEELSRRSAHPPASRWTKWEKSILDLTLPTHSYFYGFALGDGTISLKDRNRGRFSIELHVDDLELLMRFQDLFPVPSLLKTRTRDTNFKKGHRAATWTVTARIFREELMAFGFPAGKKDAVIRPPDRPFCKRDFFRGLVDADGSLGYAPSMGKPFLSLVTKSNVMADAFKSYLESVTAWRPTTTPNKRDSAYNIMVIGEKAQLAVQDLYVDADIALARKAAAVPEMLRWSAERRAA